MNREQKICQNCKNQFVIEPDDFSFYEKMGVPAPVICPECRFKRRAAFRNEFRLYNRKCDLCAQSIVSMYHPKATYTVYCPDCWHSDKWDPFSYGKNYDFGRKFFDQFSELMRAVPKIAIYRSDVVKSVNSPYENFAGGNKDCYLISNSGPKNENCAYSRGLIKCHDVFDSYYVDESELSYEGVGVHNSAGVFWSDNVVECLDSGYLFNCPGFQDCFGCVNLRQKKYLFLNEPFSKEEYQKRIEAIRGSYRGTKEFQRQFETLALRFPRRENSNLKSAGVTGNYIFESKNCRASFEVSFCENLGYAFSIKLAKDAYDIIGHGRNAELLLETVAVGYSSRIIACWWAENCQNVEYSLAVRGSENCFGCDGVKKTHYAILNKLYSEDEYKKIRAHIIEELKQQGEYGLFFPPSFAPFAYNETIVQENFSLNKEEAIAQGYRWEEDLQMTKGKETLKPEAIPDHIKDVPESITNEILVCIVCSRNYRIIPAELQFYRRMILPIPRKCFYCRHQDRIRRRGPMKIFDRTCANCKKLIKTSYAPDRPEIIYCEACYQQEVV